MNRIKEMRKERGVTVAELAQAVGTSQSMLSNYERGVVTPRDDSIWDKLASYFGVSKSHIMGLSTDISGEKSGKPFRIVVDTSKPMSVGIDDQTDLDILMNLYLIDKEDKSEVLAKIKEILARDKYEGRRVNKATFVVGDNKPDLEFVAGNTEKAESSFSLNVLE